jgi:hypothetical protein
MKKIAALLLITQLALLSGCSSFNVNHDFDRNADFASYQTYDWIPQPASVTGAAALQRSTLVDERIKNAVNNELEAKGMRPEGANPDLLLAYHVGVEDRIDVTDWGYTYVGRYPGWAGHDVDVYHYREGTLVLDIIDASSKKLVWRGSAQGTLDVDPTPEQRERKINEAVAEILSGYPPK